MGRSNVFSLEQIYRKQVVGTWSKIPEVFRYVNAVGGSPLGTDYGYFAGGNAPGSGGPYSTVDRLDFTSDTTNMVTKGPLSSARAYGSGVSNTSYGYACGGGWPTGSLVDRVDYSNDSATASVKGSLETNTGGPAGPVSNNTHGYLAAGRISPGSWTTEIQRIEFANDTATSVVKGTVSYPAGAQGLAGTGNMNYGWFGGGRLYPGPGYISVSYVGRIDYTNDTQTAPSKGPLTQIRGFLAATGNANYGYFGGGIDQNGPAYMSIVDRVDYSNDTANASPKGPLADGKHYISATGNTSYGYWAGGYGNTSKSQRVDFSNDTATAVVKGSLSQLNANQYGFSSKICNLPTTVTNPVPATRTEQYSSPSPYHHGYWIGGDGGGSRYNRVDFSNDTGTAGVRGNWDRSLSRHAAVSSTNHAYAAGGWSNTNISRIAYADDTTTAIPKGNLPPINGLSSPAGVDNVNYGYICGGLPLTTVNRIDYANDTATASTRGPLSATRRYVSATGNQSYGYVIAGTPPDFSSVERIDYSNDSITAAVKGPLPYTVYGHGATGNADYGYATAGFNVAPGNNNWISSTSRIDYSNDTQTAVSKGPLSQARRNKSTGNTSYGWSGGGSAATPSQHSATSTIDRIDFSNDTATASVRGPLSGGRTNLYTASSLANAKPQTVTTTNVVDKGAEGYTNTTAGPAYGYFAGSYNNRSSVDRVDYNNDTATASPKGNLPSDASQGGGAGNRSYGYTFSGWAPSIATTVYRVDYANDTAVAATKGPVSLAGNYARSVGNADYGYTGGRGGGGVGPIDTSIIDRVDYANDTATATVVNPAGMVPGARIVAAVGNQSYGYFAGGTSSTSVVRRLDYSSDTTATSPKGPLSAARGYCGPGTGNADYGYVLGQNPSQGPSTDVDRIDYSNDTATALTRGKRSINPSNAYPASISGVSNPTYAYFGGGDPASTHVDRIEFSNDTPTASPKGNLATARKSPYSFSAQNSGLPSATYIPRIRWVDSVAEVTAGPSSHGYAELGENRSLPYPYNTSFVDRIDFSNDTVTASPVANFSTNAGGVSTRSHSFSSPTHGYVASRSPYRYEKMEFTNDTATTVTTATYSVPQEIACSSNAHFGYVGGGNNRTAIYRYDYANDNTNVVQKGPLSTPKYWFSANGNQNYGYFNSAIVSWPSNTYTSIVDRIDYSNDTATASPKGTLSVADAYDAGMNSATGNADYSWIGGGFNRSIVNRIDYSNDTAQASLKGPLSDNQAFKGSTGNYFYGYFFGGQNTRSVVDRIDYSSDTTTASPKGPLSSNRYWQGGGGMGAAKNGNVLTSVIAPVQPPFPFPVQLNNPTLYGYIGSGGGPLTSVDRITYASDTATATPKGNLTANRYKRGGTGNKNYGYISAGRYPYSSTMDRIDYSNDSATATARGPLTQARAGSAAVGNASYGYWFGGGNPSYRTRVDRLDFANDSATAVIKGSLTAARGYGSAVGNQNYGYHCGGSDGNPKSNIDRVDYSNDTPTMSPKGQLSYGFSSDMADFSNSNYGWLAGRSPGPARSIVDRVDFSNDTATASARGPLTEAKAGAAGTGNANYGYACGGLLPSYATVTTVERVDYSNDTATASIKGPLASARRYGAGVSATDNGL